MDFALVQNENALTQVQCEVEIVRGNDLGAGKLMQDLQELTVRLADQGCWSVHPEPAVVGRRRERQPGKLASVLLYSAEPDFADRVPVNPLPSGSVRFWQALLPMTGPD